MDAARLTVRSIRARAVEIPMARPLATAGGYVGTTPLVLVDLETHEGVTGSACLYCFTRRAVKPLVSVLEELEGLINGEVVAPLVIEARVHQALRFIGAQGLMLMGLSGIDMAAWDALAKAAGLPLARYLGGAVKPIPAYNSNGLGIGDLGGVAEEAHALVAPGFRAVKIRLGYPHRDTDVAVVRAVASALGPEVTLMSDYNQCLSLTEAQQRIRRLDQEGLYWIEEPVIFHDYDGCRRIREKAATAIQIGENCWGPPDMKKALDAGACDYFMPDLGKIGGVTGWLRASALAEAAGIPMSSHLYSEYSAHLLAVTPTAHWLEYVDWLNPVLRRPLEIREGAAVATDAPGAGIEWDEEAVARYRV